MTARRLLPAALALYPPDFRVRFEAEMRATIAQALDSSAGPLRRAHVAISEAGGLLAGAVREWIVKLGSDPLERARRLPDCRLMRPVGITRAEWGAGLTQVRLPELEP
jgi:hypothetical protein